MRRHRRIPFVAQLGSMDCGIACLTMIFNYYGCKTDIVDVGMNTYVGRDGMTLAKMKSLAEEYGFVFAAYKYNYCKENLNSNLPAILLSSSHYIVVERVKHNGKYVVLDPAKGKHTVDFNELKKFYRDILVLINPGVNVQKKSGNRIKLEIKWLPIVTAAIFMFLAQLITLCVPLIIQYIIDNLENNKQINLFNLSFVILIIVCSYLLLSWLRQTILLQVNVDIFKRMISNLIHKIFSLDISFFEWHSAGDIGNRFNNLNQLNDIITNGLSNIIIQGAMSIVCLVVMVFISPQLVICTIGLAIFQIMIMLFLNKKNLLKTREYIFTQSKMQGDLVDTLGNIIEIKCMGLGDGVESNLYDNYLQLMDKFKDKTRISNAMSCFVSVINLVFPLMIYLVGSYNHANSGMTIGTLIAFATLVGYFTAPFTTIVMMLPSINSVREVLLRYKELMSYREHTDEGQVLNENLKSIDMINVSYSYDVGSNYALHEVSLKINCGEKIAIVGLSGSGKSTLVKALLGTISISQGAIYINECDINRIAKKQIYKWFSIVTQNPMCLNDTIRKNIDFNGNFSDNEIWKALNLAELKEEIENMPLGLDTIVGENGQNISGGQKQRLAIARALLNDTEVIIFDEATSNLDQLTEKKIYNNLQKMKKTQIIITHRLASIYNADRIYVLHKGKLIEKGTHAALMQKKGWYYESIQ
mgnify:CR=1 FL=1